MAGNDGNHGDICPAGEFVSVGETKELADAGGWVNVACGWVNVVCGVTAVVGYPYGYRFDNESATGTHIPGGYVWYPIGQLCNDVTGTQNPDALLW